MSKHRHVQGFSPHVVSAQIEAASSTAARNASTFNLANGTHDVSTGPIGAG